MGLMSRFDMHLDFLGSLCASHQIKINFLSNNLFFTFVYPKVCSPITDVAIRFEKNNQRYLVSMPIGVKSNLCLVWNRRVLLRISNIDGG